MTEHTDTANRPVILLGGGGHARVVLDMLRLNRFRVIGMVAPIPPQRADIPWLGTDDVIAGLTPATVALANGIGISGPGGRRNAIFATLRDRGFHFPTLIHPAATVAEDVVLGMGVQICAGAVVQPGARIGENALVNTRASVDHDCLIGAGAHIAPGATLCGSVSVGDSSYIGAGAAVIQGVTIGDHVLVGAGAVVLRDLAPGVRAWGVPSRVIAGPTPMAL